MNHIGTLKAGDTFNIIQGALRVCTITWVTRSHVWFSSSTEGDPTPLNEKVRLVDLRDQSFAEFPKIGA